MSETTRPQVSRKALLMALRRNFTRGQYAGFRWWEAGPMRYCPSWRKEHWPDVFLDAEIHYREAKKAPGCTITITYWIKSDEGEVSGGKNLMLLFEHRSLYRATYQLHRVEVDGQDAEVVG